MLVSLIVAHGPNREIGLNNKLLWHLPEDLKNFKKITTGRAIVMGRKTFESIGRALPNRLNIILTRDESYDPKDTSVCVVHDPAEALAVALDFNDDDSSELVVCGGEEIYKAFMPFVQRIYLTTTDYQGEADTYFPQLNPGEWSELSEERFESFKFKILERV